MYKPCKFNRKEYLGAAFDEMDVSDFKYELSEFNWDTKDLACELAYTRYLLARHEEITLATMEYIMDPVGDIEKLKEIILKLPDFDK